MPIIPKPPFDTNVLNWPQGKTLIKNRRRFVPMRNYGAGTVTFQPSPNTYWDIISLNADAPTATIFVSVVNQTYVAGTAFWLFSCPKAVGQVTTQLFMAKGYPTVSVYYQGAGGVFYYNAPGIPFMLSSNDQLIIEDDGLVGNLFCGLIYDEYNMDEVI